MVPGCLKLNDITRLFSRDELFAEGEHVRQELRLRALGDTGCKRLRTGIPRVGLL